jgi:hypothetical protein
MLNAVEMPLSRGKKVRLFHKIDSNVTVRLDEPVVHAVGYRVEGRVRRVERDVVLDARYHDLALLAISQTNRKEATINRVLDGSMYPG